MPTRVINVGVGHTMGLFLTDKNELSQGAHYIALSHCWGQLTKEDINKWCDITGNKEGWNTTNGNIRDRMEKGFLITELPQTFQDIITITRELGL
jgi:hypothetical protein